MEVTDQQMNLRNFFDEEQRKHLLLNLYRIRDFISLLLTYPIRTGHESRLRAWAHQASNGDHMTMDHLHRLLWDSPLTYLGGLIPMEVIMKIWISIDGDEMPDAILSLAADLAVQQLIQTLLSGDDDHFRSIHLVKFSTRNGIERSRVFEKIKLAFKGKDNMPRFNETFQGLLCVDASVYQGQVEVHVLQEIARQLQLPMMDDDCLLTSVKEEMSKNKYLVLLVDGDGQESLDPQNVGFAKGELVGVMVLISTVSRMQVNQELSMDLKIGTKNHLLPWEVFWHALGKYWRVYSSKAIQKVAVSIVLECGSHLLALVLVAKLLKNVEDVEHWIFVLDNLRGLHLPSYDISWFHGQSRVMVNAFTNLIWNHIGQTQKHCLLCCLFVPEIKDGKLDTELMNDWISSLFMDTREAHHNLRKLIECSVLLQFKDTKSRYIQMPYDIYAILQSLNTHYPLFMKKAGLELTEPPNIALWQNAVLVELGDNKLSELPLPPNFLELKVLKLQGNVDLMKIPPEFFIQMSLLRLIDLSYTSVRELPGSFFELEQLRELYLKSCERFMKLPPEIGKLKTLEKLDLDGTQIIHLPEEVQELTNMQSLTLCFYEYRGKKSKQYSCSTIIPSGVISKLKWLKQLSIDVNPDEERWHENVQVILPEILGLNFLQTISLYIPQPELLKLIPQRIFCLNFRFIVGQHMQRIISGTPFIVEAKFKQSDCRLKFVKGVDVTNAIKKVVKHSKALFLDRHMTIKSLSNFEMINLERLRVCILAECKEMQTIIDGKHLNSDNDMLSHLLLLSVSYMKNLRSIWEAPVPPPHCFLGMLKFLALQNCPKLTTVFTLDFLGNLSLLKELLVKECPKVSTLISASDGSSELKPRIFLPKLRKILLLYLPELINISNGFHIGPNLEILGVYDCPKLQSLSKMGMLSQNLKIKGETKWWQELKWSKVDWEKVDSSSKFGDIFYSINKEADVMSQLEVYNDDEDGPVAGIVDEPLQPSSGRILKDKRQNTNIRRLTLSTSKIVSEGTLQDGYHWRKCGEENNFGSEFSRSYTYTCSNTLCSAQKQLQRLDKDPTLFEVTYWGRHTCTQASNNDVSVIYSTDTHRGKQASNAVFDSFSSTDDLVFAAASNDDSVVTELTQASSTCKTVSGTLQPFSERSFKGHKQHADRRRKTWSMSIITEGPSDDGFIWRKYGRKQIPGAKFPRIYYRCNHRFDKNCRALKHVERLEEKPDLYRVTYHGHHTCRNLLNPEITFDFGSPSDSSLSHSFGNTLPTKQDHPFFSSSLPSVKIKNKEEISSTSCDSDLPLFPPKATSDDGLTSSDIDTDSDIEQDTTWRPGHGKMYHYNAI